MNKKESIIKIFLIIIIFIISLIFIEVIIQKYGRCNKCYGLSVGGKWWNCFGFPSNACYGRNWRIDYSN